MSVEEPDKKILRIAVISDLHAYTDVDTSGKVIPSYFKTDDLESPEKQHPIKSLLSFIRNQDLTADLLICCGDLGDKADKRGIREAWASVHRIAECLKADYILATAGNHDIDSRYQLNEYDAKGFLQALEPPFPFKEEEQNDKYWARHFVIVEAIPFCRIIVLNSSAFHGNSGAEGEMPEYGHGRISPFTVERLRQALKKTKPSLLNLLVCHHHPLKHSDLNLGDYDDMKDGQLLLDFLETEAGGEWMVVHGHKHHPKLRYAQGGGGAPVIFSAGSFCAVLPKELQGNARNQFYIIDFTLKDIERMGLVGVVNAWDWDFGKGMRPAIVRSGLPAAAGFGYRGQARGIARSILSSFGADLQKAYLTWEELLVRFPEIRYLLPSDLHRLAAALADLGVSVSPQDWAETSGHFDEIGLLMRKENSCE